MKLSKCIRRDYEREKRRKGHREDGRSTFVIREIQRKRVEEIKRNRLIKQQLLEGEQDES